MTNTLVMRGHGRGNPSFSDLVQAVRNDWIQVQAHQDLPFEKIRQKILEESPSGGDDSKNSLFQVMFDYQYSESGRSSSMPVATMAGLMVGDYAPASTFGGLHLEPVFSGASCSPYELALVLADIDGSLAIKWTYQTELFSSETISRMAQV
jgi:non-ribosomal peptide synthetase component F